MEKTKKRLQCIQCKGEENLLKFGYPSAEKDKLRICKDCLKSNMAIGDGYRRCACCGKIYGNNVDMRPLLKDGIGYYRCMFCENKGKFNIRKGYGVKVDERKIG